MTEIHRPDRAPHEPFDVGEGMLVVPLRTPTLPPATHTNCVLVGTDEIVVVDPASPYSSEQDRLAQIVSDRGVPVRGIWLTHHHADHVGAVEEMRARWNVPVYAHRATRDRLEGQIHVDSLLLDGDVEELGSLRIEVLHTPGHARGHLAFSDLATGRLVAGDLVAGQGTVVIDPPEGDMVDYLVTLAALIQRGVGTLIPAHGPALSDGEACLLRYIAHRRAREEQILEVFRGMTDGTALPIDLVPQVYPEVPPVFHPLAARQVLAHLLKLELEGLVARPEGSVGVPGAPVYMESSAAPAQPDVRFRLIG